METRSRHLSEPRLSERGLKMDLSVVYNYGSDWTVSEVFNVPRSVSYTPSPRKTYVPFTADTGVLTNGSKFAFVSNGAVGETIGITPVTSSYNDWIPLNSVYLGDGYFATLLHEEQYEASNTRPRWFQVIHCTGPSYAQCSPNTIGGTTEKGAKLLPMYQWFPNEAAMDLIAPDLIAICGLASTTSFAIRTLWLPAL